MCGGYPSGNGAVIASLRRGDEVTMMRGNGFPAAEEDRTAVVVEVDGFSALLNDGTLIACHDDVVPTGRHFEDGEFEVSEAAQAILARVHAED